MSDKRFWGGEIPWVTSKDMKVSPLRDAIDHVTPLAVGRGTRLIDPGSILVVVRGMSLVHSLPVALVERPLAFNQDLKALVPHSDVNTKFILACLKASQAQILLLASEATHGTKRLPTRDLLATNIPMPSEGEQKAIAQALADVDDLTQGLEKLIAKKRAVKQAAMQQLLSGRTRLPGFRGDWERRRFGELLTIRHGRSQHDIAVPDGKYPILASGGEIGRTDTPLYDKPAVLLGRKGTIDAPQYAATPFWTIDTLFYAEVSSEVCTKFVFYKFCMVPWINYNEASGVPSLNARTIESVEIKLPKLDEQRAVAAVLSDMDDEIAILERRRGKTKQIKLGMLQQLLSGRIRLTQSLASVRPTKGGESHSWAFNEAVVISALAKTFGSQEFPLGRKRYTKLSYLLHRHAEKQVEGYLKKAAGPYNPKTKYGGPERIAVQNNYMREHKNGPYRGFVAAENIAQAEAYFEKWYGADCVKWLEQFRFIKNDELEVLATVDMAAEELRATRKSIDVDNVKALIRSHEEWRAKLGRQEFSDVGISKAIKTVRKLFA